MTYGTCRDCGDYIMDRMPAPRCPSCGANPFYVCISNTVAMSADAGKLEAAPVETERCPVCGELHRVVDLGWVRALECSNTPPGRPFMFHPDVWRSARPGALFNIDRPGPEARVPRVRVPRK